MATKTNGDEILSILDARAPQADTGGGDDVLNAINGDGVLAAIGADKPAPKANDTDMEVDPLAERERAAGEGLLKALGYAGGFTSNAIGELWSRLKTGKGLGQKEWIETLKGNSTPLPEHLKNMGYSTPVAYGAGLPLAAISDPMPGGNLFKAAKALKTGGNVWKALLLGASKEAPSVLSPIANATKATGKATFSAPFRAADASFIRRRDAGKFPEKAFSELLWNNGDPLVGGFSKSNTTIKNEIKDLRKGVYDNMVEGRASVPEIDFAPEATSYVRKAGEEAIEATRQQLAKTGAAIPDDQLKVALEQARSSAEDAAASSLKGEIMAGIGGEANARKASLKRLKELAPDFADMIDENAKRFRTGDKKAATDFFTELVDDVFTGPRDIEEVSKLGQKYGREAAGTGKQMASNLYLEGGKISPKAVNAAGKQKTIADLVEDRIADAIESYSPGQGQAAKDSFKASKKRYATLAQGEPIATKALEKAEAAPWITKGEAAVAGASLMNPKILAIMLAGKGQQLLSKSPRFATGVGRSLNKASEVGIWDAMLRRGLLDKMRTEENE